MQDHPTITHAELTLQGGMPVLVDGAVAGAVGVSGSSGDDDQAVAAEIAGALAAA